MFTMIVTDAIKLHENLTTVAGSCTNKSDFSGHLVDRHGNLYDAHIPFDKPLVSNDDTKIILGITGLHNADFLKGQILKSV